MINDNQKENILNLMQLCVQILPNVRGGDLTFLAFWSGIERYLGLNNRIVGAH